MQALHRQRDWGVKPSYYISRSPVFNKIIEKMLSTHVCFMVNGEGIKIYRYVSLNSPHRIG